MTDYKKDTGNSGEMMIRDTGTTVEFWLNSHNGSTFVNELPWGYTINDSFNNDRESRYSAGAGWVRFGSWNVTYDQTVTFRIFDTGTSGFGGPTTLSVSIERAKVPNAPSTPVLSAITSTGINVKFTDGSNNGAAIDSRQIARKTNSSISGATIAASDGDTPVIGLTPGTTYWFWARTHNAKGYSPWSGSRSATTLDVPDAPDPVIVSSVAQTSVVVSFTDNSNNGSPVTARQIGYGTSGAAPQLTASYSGTTTITGLKPGTVYYFWARVQNGLGWSPYSTPVSMKTVAGARINVGGVYKDAVPYVKDGGVWKIARPWGRIAGVWKETI